MSDQTADTAPRLSPDDISELLRAFAASGWTGMRLQAGDVTVAVGKDAPPPADLHDPSPEVSGPSSAELRDPRPAEVPARERRSPGHGSGDGSAALRGSVGAAHLREQERAADIDETGLATVTSPTVGEFWVAPDPGSPPFVEVGAHVAAGDQLGIVEVMKLMNPVITDVAGEVVAVRARNADMVEFGQTLFLIRPDE